MAASVAFSHDAVHVWSIDLEGCASTIEALSATLSADERDRAARFHFERDRRRFVCARGVLRCLLAQYLETNPAAIAFTYGARGKPRLANVNGDSLSFNLSHSHELALVAVAPASIEVGVDVELIRPMTESYEIAARCFAPGEAARLRALPSGMSEAAFFRCWTRKEAYVKAVGDGLARPLDGFEVTFVPDEPIELRVIGDARETARWRLAALDLDSSYAAALVASRRCGAIEYRRWTASTTLTMK